MRMCVYVREKERVSVPVYNAYALAYMFSPGVIVVILTYPHIILSISIFYFNASI